MNQSQTRFLINSKVGFLLISHGIGITAILVPLSVFGLLRRGYQLPDLMVSLMPILWDN